MFQHLVETQNIVRRVADANGLWAAVPDDELGVPYGVRYELRPATDR